jgi:type IV secretory pathway VirB2 component (pilin)
MWTPSSRGCRRQRSPARTEMSQEMSMRNARETILGLAAALATTPALAQTADPAGSGPILAALQWIEGTLMGNVATTAAVIAVAVVGLMMLTGRIDWRRGLVVVLGAFIIFGAAAIVEGMRSIVAR